MIEYGTGERFHTGEKAARTVAREGRDIHSPDLLARLIRSSGTFGKVESFKADRRGKLRFSRNIRAVQAKLKSRNALTRALAKRSKVAKALRSGHPTGRVVAKPFFVRTFKATVGAVQTAQLAVLKREVEAAARAA